jgi:hypothetical protein
MRRVQFSISLTPADHARLTAMAKANQRSLSFEVSYQLHRAWAAAEKKAGKP